MGCGHGWGRFSYLWTSALRLQQLNSEEPKASKNENICPECGWHIDSSFSWCPNCGTRLLPYRCKYCGSLVPLPLHECQHCGAAVE